MASRLSSVSLNRLAETSQIFITFSAIEEVKHLPAVDAALLKRGTQDIQSKVRKSCVLFLKMLQKQSGEYSTGNVQERSLSIHSCVGK